MMNGLMYLIRVVILVLGAGSAILFCKKRQVKIIVSVLVFVLVCISIIIPPESFFLRFDTPEQAFRYTNYRYETIEDTLLGEESAMIISKGRNEGSIGYFKKDNDGYRILGFGAIETVRKEMTKDGLAVVERVKGTNDCYCYGFPASEDVHIDEDHNDVRWTEDGMYYYYSKIQGKESDDTQR